MKDKKTSHRKEMHEELHAIYRNKSGELPDLTRLEHVKKSSFTGLLVKFVLGLLVIAAVAWGGFFAWTKGIFQETNVLVTEIEGPEDVQAGEETFYTIRYANTGDVPLAALELKLNLPFGFELTSSSPAPTQDTTWTIGSVSAGTDGSIVISGIMRTEVPSTETLQAFFTYRPANFSSDFQDIATKTVNVAGSILSLTLSGPEKALPGDEVRYIVNVQNTGRTTAQHTEVSLEFPTGFSLTSSEPSPAREGFPVWTIATLEPGELTAITLHGTFSSSVSGEQELKARASFLDKTDAPLAQAQSAAITDVLGGGVAFSLIVDGSRENITAKLADRLRVSIDWANTGSDAVEDFSFALLLSTPDGRLLPVDWENSQIDSGIRSGNTISWSAPAVEMFERLDPGATGVIDLTLALLESVDLSKISDTFTFNLTGSMQKIGAIESPRSIDATPISVTLNSDLSASAQARYYTTDGEPLGTGPLPPQAGQSTSYRIFWDLENSLHPLEDIIVTATLPTDVIWKDRTETGIGTISFNETTRLISWKIDKLPLDLISTQASFELVITPKESDVGSFFKLTNAMSVSAKDSVSGAGISVASDVLTSELPEDEFARGKGVVEE